MFHSHLSYFVQSAFEGKFLSPFINKYTEYNSAVTPEDLSFYEYRQTQPITQDKIRLSDDFVDFKGSFGCSFITRKHSMWWDCSVRMSDGDYFTVRVYMHKAGSRFVQFRMVTSGVYNKLSLTLSEGETLWSVADADKVKKLPYESDDT